MTVHEINGLKSRNQAERQGNAAIPRDDLFNGAPPRNSADEAAKSPENAGFASAKLNLLLAVGLDAELPRLATRLANRDELSGHEVKRRELLDIEFKVFGFLRKQHGAGEPGGEQGVFHFLP